MRSESPRRLLALFTSLDGIGGIQQAGRASAAALMALAGERRVEHMFLALNDRSGLYKLDAAQHPSMVRGFGRNKVRLAADLARVVRNHDGLYIGHPHLAPLGMWLKLFRPTLQYWVVAHGIEAWAPLPLQARRALHRARGVLAVSSYTGEKVAAVQGVAPHRIHIVPNAIPPGREQVAAGRTMRPLDSAPTILSVGRLANSEPGKGLDTVIRALPAIRRCIPDVRYVVVGDGDERATLEILAHRMGVTDCVHFLGHVAADVLADQYRAASVFVLPSRQEGFGMVFLEAMAHGKPVVAARCGGSVDVVQDGITGFLVPYGDADSLADRIVRLLSNPQLRRTMGSAGCCRLETEFSFNNLKHRLEKVLFPHGH